MTYWSVEIEAWPHSTGVGADEDQKACGDRCTTFTVGADDISAAAKIAKLIAAGVETNPRVWQAPIVSIVKVPHT